MTHYVVDLQVARMAHAEWTRLFPTITPYYAVKCNPDLEIVRVLAELGAGFDCASPAEIDIAQKYSNKIIYANPCKHPSDVKYALSKGVTRTTIDSLCEIDKSVGMDLVLRIRADDPSALCTLGNKYGAGESDWEDLAGRARDLGSNIVGVSFHIGSGARSTRAYADAIYTTARAFEALREYGFDPKLVDIGGGFSSSMDLEAAAEYIHDALKETGLDAYEVIAEPGRYFAENMVTLHTEVIGMKPGSVTIDESLYGAFNCILMDHAEPEPEVDTTRELDWVTLFGSTCDGGDIIARSIELPCDLSVGDFIEWRGMGAYTMAATSNFNGIQFSKREIIYVN